MKKLGKVLGDSGQHFVVDRAYAAYLEQKLAHLSKPERCGGLSAGLHDGLEEALWRVFALVAEEHPMLVALEDGGLQLKALGIMFHARSNGDYRLETLPNAPLAELGQRAQQHLKAQQGIDRLIHALALSVQEDFVILRDLGNDDEAECLCVAFPSHWNPNEKIGQNFSELHRPVADAEALLKSHRPVMNALFHKGPFIRFVWGLSADARLSQHPALPQRALKECSPDALAQQLTFRTERQVSCPLPHNRCLFTVRVAVQPLQEALYNAERRRRMGTALALMDDALLAYKGLTTWRESLLAYLNA